MPRPPLKRRKPNQSSPKRRVESPKNVQLRQQLDRKLAHKPIGQRPADSDDSDRLVTRSPNETSRGSTLRREIYASGAVKKGDRPGSYPTRAERRRNLQNDTARILKENQSRSRSTQRRDSDTNSPATATQSSVKKLPAGSQINAATKPVNVPEPPRTVTKVSRGDALFRTGSTPLGETSILGTLKPRRRQASILHLIDNEDSSIINPEDEDRFLPDDESTPLNSNKLQKSGSDQQLQSSVVRSRKRKFGDEEPNLESHNISTVSIDPGSAQLHRSKSSSRSPISLQTGTQLRSQSPVLSPHPSILADSDIMALPQSSSPETTPKKNHSPPATQQQPAPAPLSTKQLQSLMPSKRRRGARERTRRTEFDISEDTSDPLEEPEDSVFLPKKKATRNQKKLPKEKTSKSGKKSGATGAKAKKSTTLANPRHVSVSLRTPMPLTRSSNAENLKLKSPLQHSNSVASKDPNCKRNGGPANMDASFDKQSGGFRPGTTKGRRNTRESKSKEAMLDQENMTTEHSLEAGEADTLQERNTEMPAVFDDVDELEPEIEVGRGIALQQQTKAIDEDSGLGNAPLKSNKSPGWNSRWADIDDWSLDFEVVDVSTGSSSPLRR